MRPIYALERPRLWFRGIELSRAALPCFAGLSRVRELLALPLLLDARLSADWRTAPRHQTFGWEASGSAGPTLGRVYTIPEDLSISRALLDGPAPELDRVVFAADIVQLGAGGRLSVSGRAAGPFTYLLTTEARRPDPGAYLMAQGEIAAGGLVIGLLKDGRWARHVEVVGRGPFLVVIQPDGEGPFTRVVANHVPGVSRWNRLVLDRLGWIRVPEAHP